MPVCIKCKKKFPNRIIIDGRIRNLSSRKYCLECSEFGKHNTKPIEDKTKTCHQCKRKFIHSRNGGSRSTICNSCRTKNSRKKKKEKLIQYKGNKCEICGYDKCKSALEFHHKDPSKKDFSISEFINKKLSELKKESDKCILVCANCHREIHEGLLG